MVVRKKYILMILFPGVNPLLQNAPNLMHFKWWRIIADEAHEIMTYDQRHIKSGRGKNNQNDGSQGLQALSVFPSYYRWYVTGTPFPHAGKSLRAALKVNYIHYYICFIYKDK